MKTALQHRLAQLEMERDDIRCRKDDVSKDRREVHHLDRMEMVINRAIRTLAAEIRKSVEQRRSTNG